MGRPYDPNSPSQILIGVENCFFVVNDQVSIKILKKEAVRLCTLYPYLFDFDFVKENGSFNRSSLYIRNKIK